jgi:hypothetical protein
MDGVLPQPTTDGSNAYQVGGRLWLGLAGLLVVASLGSWLSLVLAKGLANSACYELKPDAAADLLCHKQQRHITDAWHLIILVAVVSAVIMLLIGLLEGWQRRRYASGRRQPLRILPLSNPAGMVGYLVGRLLGWLLSLAVGRKTPPAIGRASLPPQ